MAFDYSQKRKQKTLKYGDKRAEALMERQEVEKRTPPVPVLPPKVTQTTPQKPKLTGIEPDLSKVRLTPEEQLSIQRRNVSSPVGAFAYGAQQAVGELTSAIGGAFKPRTAQEIEMEQLARKQPSVLPKLKYDVSRGYGAPNVQETKPLTPFEMGQVASFAVTPKLQPVETAIGAVAGKVVNIGSKGVKSIASKLSKGQKLTAQEIKVVTQNPNIIKELGVTDDAIEKVVAQQPQIAPQVKPPTKVMAEQIQAQPKVVAESINVPTLTKAEVKQELKTFKEPLITPGMKERGASKNVRTDVNMPDELRQSFSDDPLEYAQLANKTTLEKAEYAFNKGFDEALNTYNANRNMFKPENVPLAKLIAKEYVKRGDVNASRQIISDVAEELTRAGQFGQAARILRESGDPVTLQLTIEKQLKKLNEDGSKLYGDKWTPVQLTDDEYKMLASKDKLTEEEIEQTMNAIGDRIAKDMPVTGLEKFNTWRRVAMLLNPKTHVRNIAGNSFMRGLDSIKDTVAAGLESGAVKIGKMTPEQQTKSFGWRNDEAIKKAVDDSWEANKKDLMKETKYDVFTLNALGREKPIFKTKWLETLNQVSKNALEAEDAFFMRDAYKQSLGSFMKARGLKEPTEEAIKYATNYAQEATFRQASAFADFLNKAKKQKGFGTLIDAAVPFTKTPINILKRSVDYTPVSIAKAMFTKGKEPYEVIEQLSKGLTGSGLITLGFMLGASGYARGGYRQSKSEEGLLGAAGEQPYSIITPQGSYTFDWAQPVSVPIAMGIAAYEGFKEKEQPLDAIVEAFVQGGETIVNQSMLKNVKELFGGQYGTATEAISQLPISYLEQAFPTAVGQLARTIDPVKRETYAPTGIGKEVNRMQAKIPFVSKSLQPKVDIWGNEVKAEGTASNAVQQFLSPGYAKSASKDDVTKGLLKVYKERKLTEMLPNVALKKFKVDGTQYEPTPEEYTQMQKRLGQLNYQSYKRIIGTIGNMTDKQIIDVTRKIKDDNWDTVKREFITARSQNKR